MDAWLDLISVRAVREFDNRPIPDDVLRRILEAGRATGSSVNRQEWKFYVVRDRDHLSDLAHAVYAPDNLRGCCLAIAVTSAAKSQFDAGRAVQNLILAAWAEGIGSCPNGVRDSATASSILRVPVLESIATILSLGYPARARVPQAGDAEGILQRIKRKPLDEIVVWVD